MVYAVNLPDKALSYDMIRRDLLSDVLDRNREFGGQKSGIWGAENWIGERTIAGSRSRNGQADDAVVVAFPVRSGDINVFVSSVFCEWKRLIRSREEPNHQVHL